MRTMTSVVIENNPTFMFLESTRHSCPDCKRSVCTFQRKGESHLRARWHRANSGAGTFADPIQFRKCVGSGRVIP